MDMIGHKAKCMDAMTVSLNALLHQQIKTIAIFDVKENILTGVASHDHMVQCGWVMDSWFSCHDGKLTHYIKYCKPDPDPLTSLTPIR